MTIKQAQKKYRAVEVDLLLSHVLGKPKEFLFMHPEHLLSAKQLLSLRKIIKRRQTGEPTAYILGYKDFYGLRFKVNRNVLIPRPESEWVVEKIVASGELLVASQKKIRILDVGTGSGCIAISIAKKQPANSYKLIASDISPAALAVAKQNAKMHHANIKFINSDLLQSIKDNFDIIIANLPYGWSGWKNNTSAETVGLKFEPKRALFTKEKGLGEIRRLLGEIAQLKLPPKLVYLEFDPRQKTALNKLIKKILPFWKVKFHKDFNNFWRYAELSSLPIRANG